MAFLKNKSSNQPDADLVRAFKQTQDLEVLGELYQRYMELVYGVCLKYLKYPENAQDSTLAIFEELGPTLLKHEVENFKSWLYTLSKNHCLMVLRGRKKEPVLGLDMEFMQSGEALHLEGVLEKEENFRQLEYCLSQLAEEQRRIIEWFYLEGKCYNEISEMTVMQWNKLRSAIQNGRRNLKICIEKQKAKKLVQE